MTKPSRSSAGTEGSSSGDGAVSPDRAMGASREASVGRSEDSLPAGAAGVQDLMAGLPEDQLLSMVLEVVSARSPGLLDRIARMRKDVSIVDSLVQRRKERGLTQAQVAERMGTTQPAVAKFEATLHDPRWSTVEKYAKAVDAELRVAQASVMHESQAS